MNDFSADDAFQREKRNKYVLPWYRKNGAEVTLVDDDPEFRKLGIDTILIGRKSRKVFNVEEKIVRKPYDAFALETHSCTVTGYESPGWMVYGCADFLLYCFTQREGWLDAYWINFPALKEWFWAREDIFAPFKMQTRNKTKGKVVPIIDVESAVESKRFSLRGQYGG